VIAVIDNELTVKRLTYRNGHPVLKAENPRYNDIELKDGQELQVWGIVTSTVRKLV
jgi:DNA polymerase V